MIKRISYIHKKFINFIFSVFCNGYYIIKRRCLSCLKSSIICHFVQNCCFLYIAVIILCIIIFGLTVFSSISRRFENEITDNNAQITGLAVNNMTNTMNNIEQILYSVQANSTIEKMLTASNPPSPYEEIAAIEQELSKNRPLKSNSITS